VSNELTTSTTGQCNCHRYGQITIS